MPLLHTVGALLVLAFIRHVHADMGVFGGICVPDSETVRAALYETAGFGVRFSDGRTGTIRLLCPFDNPYNSGARMGGMQLTFIDSDGMDVGGRVRAHLRRAPWGSNVAQTLGTCDSNTRNASAFPQNVHCSLSTVYKMDGRHLYWWEIVIDRSNPTVNVEFLTIRSTYPAGPPP
jgi:hypothetical protein